RNDAEILLPTGDEIPLSTVASFEVERSPWWTHRIDRQTEVRMKVRFFGDDKEANTNLGFDAMNALLAFLTENCCAGAPATPRNPKRRARARTA
ncbi:MAG: hypothetical protein ABFS41_19185, partial [Myxococcota bacterium]